MTVNNLDSRTVRINNAPELLLISELSEDIDYRGVSVVKACKLCHEQLQKNAST